MTSQRLPFNKLNVGDLFRPYANPGIIAIKVSETDYAYYTELSGNYRIYNYQKKLGYMKSIKKVGHDYDFKARNALIRFLS